MMFKPTYTSRYQSFLIFLFSSIPFAFVQILGAELSVVFIILASLSCFVIFYQGLLIAFSKRIYQKDEKIIFKKGPFIYELDVNKMGVYYEKVFILGGSSKDYYGLVLYRDMDKIFGISFNNRFVLAYEMDEVKLEIYQKKFKDLLDIEIKVVKAL